MSRTEKMSILEFPPRASAKAKSKSAGPVGDLLNGPVKEAERRKMYVFVWIEMNICMKV